MKNPALRAGVYARSRRLRNERPKAGLGLYRACTGIAKATGDGDLSSSMHRKAHNPNMLSKSNWFDAVVVSLTLGRARMPAVW